MRRRALSVLAMVGVLAVARPTFDAAGASETVEVLPDLHVAAEDAPGVREYLKARALAATNSTELYGEVVPWSYAVDAFFRPVAWCESRGHWHSHRDGLLQIIPSTWRAYGGLEFARYAGEASPTDQLLVAGRVLDGQGARAWTCAGYAA